MPIPYDVNRKVKREIDRDMEPPRRHKPGELVDAYRPEYAEQAARFVAAGFTLKDLLYVFGTTRKGLIKWREEFPEFDAAIKGGKRYALKRLIAKCQLAAEGYKYTTRKKTVTKDADGNIKSIKEEEIENYQPPDKSLALFLACNITRQLKLEEDEAWQSTQKLEINQKTLTITANLVGEQIERLAGALAGDTLPKAKPVEAIVTDVEDKRDESV